MHVMTPSVAFSPYARTCTDISTSVPETQGDGSANVKDWARSAACRSACLVAGGKADLLASMGTCVCVSISHDSLGDGKQQESGSPVCLVLFLLTPALLGLHRAPTSVQGPSQRFCSLCKI